MRATILITAAALALTGCTYQRSPMRVMAQNPVKASFESRKPIAEVEPCVVLASAKLAHRAPIVTHNPDGSTMIAATEMGYTSIVVILVPNGGGTLIKQHGGYDWMGRMMAKCSE